jgi:hypothetical protein
MIKMQTFLRNGNQKVGRYGDPYLRLDGVLAGTEEHLDAQMLLDPFEEQFHLPALTVQVGNQFWLLDKVAGQKHQAFASVVLHHHATKSCRVVLARKIGCEHAGLIAQHRRIEPNHRMRVTPLGLGVAFGAGHKECFGLVNHKQSLEIQIPPIH